MKRVCFLVLENIRSVANTGSIFRTADRFGVSKIILVGTTPAPVDRFGRARRDFTKVSLGAEKSLDWQYFKNTEQALEFIRKSKIKIVSLEQMSEARNIVKFEPPQRLALIVGNEVEGISKEFLEASETVVQINYGQKRSLNVSVATGIALFVLS